MLLSTTDKNVPCATGKGVGPVMHLAGIVEKLAVVVKVEFVENHVTVICVRWK